MKILKPYFILISLFFVNVASAQKLKHNLAPYFTAIKQLVIDINKQDKTALIAHFKFPLIDRGLWELEKQQQLLNAYDVKTKIEAEAEYNTLIKNKTPYPKVNFLENILNTDGNEIPLLFAGGLIDANALKEIFSDIKFKAHKGLRIIKLRITPWCGGCAYQYDVDINYKKRQVAFTYEQFGGNLKRGWNSDDTAICNNCTNTAHIWLFDLKNGKLIFNRVKIRSEQNMFND